MVRYRAILIFAFATLVIPGLVRAQATPHSQPAPSLWRFVDPNAKAVISIDWARIRDSQAGVMARDKWMKAGALPALSIPGLELLDEIDRVLISSPGNPAAGAQLSGQSAGQSETPSADESAQAPVLFAIHGHFKPGQVRQVFARFGAKSQSYNSFQVYRPQGKQGKDMACVLFDDETILFGDARSVFAALDRNQFTASAPEAPPAAGSIAARAAAMESNYDFWVIMDATEILSNDSVAALLRGGEWASEAQGFEAGVSLRAGLAADVTVRFSSDAVAKRVTGELTRLMNTASRDRATDRQLQDIAKKLKFNVDGSAAKISLRLTEQDVEKSAQAWATARKVAPPSPRFTVDRTAAPVPVKPPAKPPVIRIEGLDDGPREIPYDVPTQ
jgi:hypothetical protein